MFKFCIGLSNKNKIMRLEFWLILLFLTLVVFLYSGISDTYLKPVCANNITPTPTVDVSGIWDDFFITKGKKISISAKGNSEYGIKKMSILINNNSVKTSSGGKVEYEWDTSKALPGYTRITVIAQDFGFGKVGMKTINGYIFDGPTQVKITSPEKGRLYKPGDSITLSADAAGVAYVKFFAGTEFDEELDGVGMRMSQNFRTEWNTRSLKEGKYRVQAVGYDIDGKRMASDEMVVTLSEQSDYINAPDVDSRVSTEEIFEGEMISVTTRVKNEPELLFLQYKNKDGTWMTEEECKQKYSFDMSVKKKTNDGRITYLFNKMADSPGIGPDYKKTFRVCALYKGNVQKTGTEHSIIIKPQKLMPKVSVVNINPCSGYQGKKFSIYVSAKGQPQSLFLQFDDGEGGWLDEDFSKQYFSFDLTSPNSESGYSNTYMLQREIHTPGEAPNYMREFRVHADYGDGSKSETKEYALIVVPK